LISMQLRFFSADGQLSPELVWISDEGERVGSKLKREVREAILKKKERRLSQVSFLASWDRATRARLPRVRIEVKSWGTSATARHRKIEVGIG